MTRETSAACQELIWAYGCWTENRGGKPPQIIQFNKVFHYFHHPFWGTPIFGNIHMVIFLICSLDTTFSPKIFFSDFFCSFIPESPKKMFFSPLWRAIGWTPAFRQGLKWSASLTCPVGNDGLTWKNAFPVGVNYDFFWDSWKYRSKKTWSCGSWAQNSIPRSGTQEDLKKCILWNSWGASYEWVQSLSPTEFGRRRVFLEDMLIFSSIKFSQV